MKRYRRRGFFIVQILTLLPLISAGIMIALLLIGSAGRFQTRELRRAERDAILRTAMSALRADLAAATGATIEQDGARLVLQHAAGTISWELGENQLSRTVSDDAKPRRVWPLRAVTLTFSHEPIDGSAGVIWIHAGHALPAPAGSDSQMHLVTAVALGGGVP